MQLKVPVRTPGLVQKLLPGLHFKGPAAGKVLYLTFDDGPVPGLCHWILQCLDQYDAKACFFLVGENVVRNPELVQEILAAGHSIGNHSQHHRNGFQTKTSDYIQDVHHCRESLQAYLPQGEKQLFRPPYGKIKPAQVRQLRKAGFEIVMWDVLSKDYDPKLSAEQITRNVLDNVRPGSILVFHDNLKAEAGLRKALPVILKQLQQQGFEFQALRFPC
jgi:peptidoglycan/xylan/chitin deacetylase (PgdA/CDA1 family)